MKPSICRFAPPDIWNGNSPSVKMIGMEFERNQVHQWDNNRVAQLARDLHMSIWTLCAKAGAFRYNIYRGRVTDLELDTEAIQEAWRTGIWPLAWVLQMERLEVISKMQGFLGVADKVALNNS